MGSSSPAEIRPFATHVDPEVMQRAVSDLPRANRDRFVRTVDFTEREKLILLVSAIRRATVDFSDMQLEIASEFDVESFSFMAEDGRLVMEYAPRTRSQVAYESERLAPLLEEIQRETDALT